MSQQSTFRVEIRRVACAVTLLLIGVVAACEKPSEPIESPTPMPGESPFEYPVELWDLKVTGEAMLMLHVTEHGAVDSAYVLSSSGFEQLDSAAVRGAHELRFAPGRQGQRRVAMWTKLPVRFAIDTVEAVGLPAPDNGLHD